MMKAVVLRSPGQLAVADVGVPQAGPGQVLVRVSHTGICGTDLKIFTGAMPAARPVIMGHEIAGEVVPEHDRDEHDRVEHDRGEHHRRGGPSASAKALADRRNAQREGWSGPPAGAGQRVLVDPVLYCGTCFECLAGHTNLCANGGVIGREVNGGFADYAVVPASHVYPLPPSVNSREAPLIQVLTTCLHGQRRAHVSPGQSVVVIGLGVSGQLHVQLARARGARTVIGVSRSAWKRGVAEQLGADITVASGDDAIREVAAATDGHGADVVIESTGVVRSLADAIAMVRPGGTVLLFGIFTATDGALPFYQLYYKEPTMHSVRAARPEDFPESIDLVAQGTIRLAPLVTQVLPLSQLGDAIEMLNSDVDGRMKIILEH